MYAAGRFDRRGGAALPVERQSVRRWVAAHEELGAVAEAHEAMTLPSAQFVPLQLSTADSERRHAGYRDRTQARRHHGHASLARLRCWRVREVAAGMAAVIRIEAIWQVPPPLP